MMVSDRHNYPHYDHSNYMAAAIAISLRGRGNSGPNPNVGCIIVKNGHVLGRGWTQPNGRPHAEAMAIEMAQRSGADISGADIYTTLEPCHHKSPRGPDCASSIIAAKPARLICAITDPDPRTNGQGLERIKAAGINIIGDINAAQARRAMAGFLMRIKNNRPYITLKLALSLDGCIATANDVSQWITGSLARRHSHLERAHHDAILVGSGTVKADNPSLNVRIAGLEYRSPIRYQLGTTPAPDGWHSVRNMDEAAGMAHNYLMVEGGAQTAASFMRANIVDRILLYRAPIILGGKSCLPDFGLDNLSNAHDVWHLQNHMMLGKDAVEIYEKKE